MKEYSNGIKGAAIVIHQMFFVLMVCSLYGVGYDIAHHIKGIAGLSTLIVIGLVGGFVMLAYLTSVTGRHGADDPEVYLNFVAGIWLFTIWSNLCMLGNWKNGFRIFRTAGGGRNSRLSG